MRVVEVEHVRADAVQQCRMKDIHALGTPEHGGLRRTAERLHRRERALHGLVTAAADRAAEPVEQRARSLVTHAFRDVLPARSHQVAGEGAGNFHGR